MYELPTDQMNNSERAILRKLRVWIVALAVACLVAGIGIGAILAGRPAVAQNERSRARPAAPEALSASFAEIARRVEPAVVNIDTVTAAPEVAERDEEGEDKDDPASKIRCWTCCVARRAGPRAASAAASSLTRRATS